MYSCEEKSNFKNKKKKIAVIRSITHMVTLTIANIFLIGFHEEFPNNKSSSSTEVSLS